MSLKLLARYHECAFRSTKILIAAKHAGVTVETPEIEMGVTNESPEYLRNASPLGRIPVLQTAEGYIFESGAIIRHIARIDKNGGLYGRTTYENSQVDQWVDFGSTELDPFVLALLLPAWGIVPKDDKREAEAKTNVAAALQGLNQWLEIRTFLVGERLTIGDIAVATTFHALIKINPDKKWSEYANVQRWYKTVWGQAQTQAAVKDVIKLSGEVETKDAPKKEEKKKEEKPKEEKKPKKEEEDDGAEEEAFDEPKKKNPLDNLPPSKFVLDAFKREYSNKDTRTVAAPYFFDNYDPEGYTCFWCDYKYNDELKMQFMTGNLIRGWFQRMERMHKYAFGVILITGEDTKHDISGFWVFRGKGMPEVMTEVDDCEHYAWTEIKDINAEREKITDYFCWEGPKIAKPVLEGRVFK